MLKLIAFLPLLAACASSEYQFRQDHLATAKISPANADAIRRSKIKVGMTQDDVRAAWGGPCGYCRGTRKATWGDSWEYNIFGTGRHGIGSGTYVFFDKAGRVRGVSR